MASINEKLNYINETKSLIKDKLNDLGSEIEDETTFRDYAEKIENLYEEWPKISSTNTNITLNNTKKGKIKIDLKGNIEQFTTTGKNFLNIFAAPSPYTDRGITSIVNQNGSVSSAGVTTTSYFDVLSATTNINIPTGDYIFSIQEPLTHGLKLRLRIDGTNHNYIISKGNTSVSITIDGVVDRWLIYSEVGFGVGDTINETFYPMLRPASISDDNFEPYTGEMASPNSDYPQEIKVVTSNNTIVILNENNTENQTFTINLGELELCKIESYQDYIYKNNNKWYKKPMILKINSYDGETISTNYKSTTGSLTTGATIYYVNPNNNPDGIEITNTTLITQLNTLEQAISYDNQTNISQTNDNLPFIISASALLKNSN